jgi:hypothetical protein
MALLACTNEQSALGPTGKGNPISPAAFVELTGVVELNGTEIEPAVLLRLPDGSAVPLFGLEASHLARVPGAEVWMRGTWATQYLGRDDATVQMVPGFAVDRFQVNAVDGRAVSDGIVVETDDGYALRLIDGSLLALIEAPAELSDLVGARIWITEMDEPPVAFGVIEQ